MWQSIKESYRYFKRNTLYSSINLGGLAIGISVFFLTQLYVYTQRQHDVFWKDHSSIYRVSVQWNEENEVVKFATAPPPLAPHLETFEEIQETTRILNWSDFTLRPDNDSSRVFRETNVYIADEGFFNVFQDRLLAGTPEALSEPGQIVLSERAAYRYFGEVPTASLVGRYILGGKDAGTLWKITGIMKNIPSESHLEMDILVSMWDEFSENDLWTWNVMHTYVRSNASKKNLSHILDLALTEKIHPVLLQEGIANSEGDLAGYALDILPIQTINLVSGWRDSIKPGIRADYLTILSGASVLILILACFNFMNISTALSYGRLRDIGIRKIHGADKLRLTLRYLSEYFVYALVAMILALGLVEIFTLLLNKWFSLQLKTSGLLEPRFFYIGAGVLLCCTIVSGAYPTWVLVKASATNLMKGSTATGGTTLRNVLIIFQFCMAVFIIGFTGTMNSQLHFIQTRELGYNRENLLIIQNDREIEEMRSSFIHALNQLPEVTAASFTTGLPAMKRYQIRDFNVQGTEVNAPLNWYQTDEHFTEVMELKIVSGTGFIEKTTNGDFQIGQVLLNESAVRQLELDDPVGRRLTVNAGAPDEHEVVVRGVVKDFHHQDFRQNILPLAMEYMTNYIFRDYVVIRLQAGNHMNSLAQIRDEWENFEPDVPMEYFFFDERYNTLFSSEAMMSGLFRIFSILGLVIAGMGLFGVVAVSSKQRTREIGIRKVLGASSLRIVQLMLVQFVMLIIAGLFIALPLSWIASKAWLEDFVYRIQLSPWMFLFMGAIVLFLAILLVSVQAWRSSRLDPVEAIKIE
jgi:putative ABC transport system permease protein